MTSHHLCCLLWEVNHRFCPHSKGEDLTRVWIPESGIMGGHPRVWLPQGSRQGNRKLTLQSSETRILEKADDIKAVGRRRFKKHRSAGEMYFTWIPDRQKTNHMFHLFLVILFVRGNPLNNYPKPMNLFTWKAGKAAERNRSVPQEVWLLRSQPALTLNRSQESMLSQ